MQMNWTFEDFKVWKAYVESKGRSELEDKIRQEFQTHGRQKLLMLFDELIKHMGFEEDMICMRGKPPRTYAEACAELAQCLGAMKIERENYDA